ncbi:MAG TPA: histidine phosphatase family protein [Terriglobia bacterium]|nr:histidine phosphatase family protein [Terriglobia bacterium]
MKYVEIFRHSMRGEGKGLSEEGKKLARRARAILSPHYDLCVSSPKERARETMETLGFERYEVDEAFTAVNPWEPFDGAVQKLAKERGIIPLAACWEIPEAFNYLRLQGETMMGAVKRIARKLPEGGRALVVSHGGLLETAALHGCARYALEEIGGEIGFCEGVVFKLDDENLAGIEVKRNDLSIPANPES